MFTSKKHNIMLQAVFLDNGKGSRKLEIKIGHVVKKINKHICAEDMVPFEKKLSTPSPHQEITLI